MGDFTPRGLSLAAAGASQFALQPSKAVRAGTSVTGGL